MPLPRVLLVGLLGAARGLVVPSPAGREASVGFARKGRERPPALSPTPADSSISIDMTPCKDGNQVLTRGDWVLSENNTQALDWAVDDCLWKLPTYPNPSIAGKKISFLGDSTLHRVYAKFMKIANIRPCSLNKRGSWYDYCEIPVPNHHPDPGVCEAPVTLNNETQRDWKGHTECTSCGPFLHACQAGTQLEFLPVEYAKDVEMVTADSQSTQETIVKQYFARSQPDIIIFSTGHHDVFMWGHPEREHCKGALTSRYKENLLQYTELLASHAKNRAPNPPKLYWISTSFVARGRQPQEWQNKTDNKLIRDMQELSMNIMRDHGVHSLDVGPISAKSFTSEYLSEGVHIDGQNGIYYEVLAEALLYSIHQR